MGEVGLGCQVTLGEVSVRIGWAGWSWGQGWIGCMGMGWM